VSVQQNKAIVERFDEVVRDGDADALDELCTLDMVNHALAETRAPGLAGTKQFLAERRRDARRREWMRGMVLRDHEVIAENDLVVQFGVLEGRWPGGNFRGFQTTSGPYATDVAFMYRLLDGRIAERWAVRDDLGMLLRLGTLGRDR
jgi:ketosteroid isomerase-like protein